MIVQYTARQDQTSIFKNVMLMHQLKEHPATHSWFGNTLLRPVDCLVNGVPFLVPEMFHVSLTIANICLGADPPACRQLPTNPAAIPLSVVIAHPSSFQPPTLSVAAMACGGIRLSSGSGGDIGYVTHGRLPDVFQYPLPRFFLPCSINSVVFGFNAPPLASKNSSCACHKSWKQIPKHGS